MKKLFILWMMIGSCIGSVAQNRITGVITNQDHAALSGVSIYIPEINLSTLTDSQGKYSLSDLPEGSMNIQFSMVGYSNRIEHVDLKGYPMEVNISLHQSAVEMEPVVISGGYHAAQHDHAVKIDVLKLEPLRMKSTPNFTEVLTKIPGVDMISKGSGVSKPVIRGLSMNDILVLNNGVRFENYQYSSHHPLGIDEFGIENVEIIKGPASLLYGSDAIGGVINFIKEKPAPVNTLVGDYHLQLFSNSLGVTQNLGIKGTSGKFFAGFRIGQKTNSDYLEGGGDFLPNSRFNEVSVKLNAGMTAQTGTFRIYYDYGHQKLGLVEDEALSEISRRGRNNSIWYQDFTTHLLSSQNRLYLKRMKLDIQSAFQSTELIHMAEVSITELQMKLSTLTWDIRLQLPSNESAEYIVGLQGENQFNKNLNNRETILLPDAVSGNYSAYGLIQYTVLKKLKLQTGIRYDYKNLSSQAVGTSLDPQTYRGPLHRTYGSLSGSVSAAYRLTEQISFRANFASAFRTPNLAELTSNGQHELRYEIGNPDLVPEKAFETDASIHYHRDNLTFDLAGFVNRLNHYIFITPTGDTTGSGIGIYRYMQENSLLTGGEAGVHIHPEKLEWLHVETTFSSVIGRQLMGDFLPFIPAHKLCFEIRAEKESLSFLRKAFFGVTVSHAFDQNRVAPDETRSPGYSLIDVSTGGHLKWRNQLMAWSISVSNALDKKYIDHLSTLKEVNRFNPGRNISVSLSIPFGLQQAAQ
jgi:iron complex outermembrane recepter protein